MSMRAQTQLAFLKFRTGVTINILARFGICLSLKDPSPVHPESYTDKGMELHPGILFGEHEKMFMALFLQRLEKDGLAPELYLQEIMRAHLNRGANKLSGYMKGNLSNLYRMIEIERK